MPALRPRWRHPPMPDTGFDNLRDYLLTSGMSQRYVRRAVAELEDHCVDAAAERPDGAHAAGDRDWIRDRLGHEAAIVAEVLARPAIRGRFCGLRLALHQGIVAEAPVMRWSASIASGAIITAALLLVMAQSIAPNG